jgi:hypothetical protein
MSSAASKVKFSEREIRFLTFLRDRYLTSKSMSHYVQTTEVPRESDETIDQIKNMISKFARFNVLKWETTGAFSIQQSLIELVHEIENPPARNHLSEWTIWWFGKPWRAAISAVAIILPLIVQWIEMLKTVLDWVSP